MSGMIASCMPVVDESTEAALMAELGPELVDMIRRPYPDSVRDTCLFCKAPIWVGPRVGAARQADPTLLLACYVCTVKYMPPDKGIVDLGNQHPDF